MMRMHKRMFSENGKENLSTYTPPATPPAMRDLQTDNALLLGALTSAVASFASSARDARGETSPFTYRGDL